MWWRNKKKYGDTGGNDLVQRKASLTLMFINSISLTQICIYEAINTTYMCEGRSCEIMIKDVSVVEIARGM